MLKLEPTTVMKLLVIASFWAYTQAQIPFWGECPNITLQENFTLPEYMGEWYELKRYYTSFQGFQSCVTAKYKLKDNKTVEVVNTGLKPFSTTYVVAKGDAIMPNPEEPAKLKVKIGRARRRGDYWVVSTDYTSYSIVWSCTQLHPYLPVSWQLAFVLTRDPNLQQDKIDEIDAILDEKQIDKTKFMGTSQTDCPGRVSAQRYDPNVFLFDMEH